MLLSISAVPGFAMSLSAGSAARCSAIYSTAIIAGLARLFLRLSDLSLSSTVGGRERVTCLTNRANFEETEFRLEPFATAALFSTPDLHRKCSLLAAPYAGSLP